MFSAVFHSREASQKLDQVWLQLLLLIGDKSGGLHKHNILHATLGLVGGGFASGTNLDNLMKNASPRGLS